MAGRPQQTVNPQVEPTPEDAERIGTLDGVFKMPEVIVGAVEDLTPPPAQSQDREMEPVIIRLNDNLDDMSIISKYGNFRYSFKAGHQYKVPRFVARELERVGKVWH